MQLNDESPTEPRMATRARIRARLRRHRATGAALALITGIGVLVATTGSASAEPSAGDWAKLRNCESGGNYAINTGNGYYGAYQFDLGTWQSVGGSGLPSDASPATQDALAYRLWQQRGWSPWACASIVGLPVGGSGGSAPQPPPPAPVARVVVARPVGAFDSVQVAASRTSVRVIGWALDRNSSSSSISVRVSVNSTSRTAVANLARTDVDRVLRVSGNHGFSVPVAVAPGTYRICVTALGRAAGNNRSLGCRTAVVRALPTGSLDRVSVVHGNASVAGWALDPNSSRQSINVHVYVNGVGYAVPASRFRADVDRILQVSGNHGFAVTLPLHPGANSVCAAAIGTDGSRRSLGCRSVRVPAPIGAVDPVRVQAGKATIRGWALDRNFPASSIRVHVYVNGVGYSIPTSVTRNDVNRALRVSGVHGFALTAPVHLGANKVCAYAIGINRNNNTGLGCVTVRR